jgi:hypothetical protein
MIGVLAIDPPSDERLIIALKEIATAIIRNNRVTHIATDIVFAHLRFVSAIWRLPGWLGWGTWWFFA